MAEKPLGFQVRVTWANSNLVGMICPLVGIGLTKFPNSDLVDLVDSLDLFGAFSLAGLVYLTVIS